ncbi:MAG: SoxR reducing system RseC family protein [bacterium]|nr:SoxR reducing system RseC family protein [bacterium]
MEEEGIVLTIAGNKATVQIEAGQQRCEHCSHKCDTQEGKILLEADNSIGASVGQKVRLQTLAYMRITGSILFFVMPTIALVCGIGGGIYWANRYGFSQKAGELIGIASGLILAGITYLLVYLSKNRLKRKLISRIVEIQ